MKFEEFYDLVIGTLGGTLVDVELDDKDVKRALNMAIRTYKQRGGNNERHVLVPLRVTNGEKCYTLPKGVSHIVRFIRDDQVSGNFAGGGAGDPFALSAVQELFNFQYGGFGSQLIIYDLSLQMAENTRQYTVNDVPFFHDRLRGKVTFLKDVGTLSCWLMDCYMNLSEEEYMESLWILRWTIAECKETLGRAYRKFGGTLPGAAGDTNLDGSELVQEAREEKRELFEDIDNFVDGVPDALGVYIG